jgi:hypothetical protein
LVLLKVTSNGKFHTSSRDGPAGRCIKRLRVCANTRVQVYS